MRNNLIFDVHDVRFTPKADMVQHGSDVRFVPKAYIPRRSKMRVVHQASSAGLHTMLGVPLSCGGDLSEYDDRRNLRLSSRLPAGRCKPN